MDLEQASTVATLYAPPLSRGSLFIAFPTFQGANAVHMYIFDDHVFD